MISVIIVSHNYGRFLSKCLTSILSNNVDYLKEIIIVDDSSKDNTFDVAKNFSRKNPRIKYFKKNFKSLSKSTNFGIKQAQAEWVTKIDADDYVSENFLENFSREIIKRKLNRAILQSLVFFKIKNINLKNSALFQVKVLLWWIIKISNY